MRRRKKGVFFFEMRDEEGKVWRENPPIDLGELQEMYDSGDLLDTSDLSRWTGWNSRYVYQLIDEYGLPYIQIGGKGKNYFFSKEKIKEWQKERKRR